MEIGIDVVPRYQSGLLGTQKTPDPVQATAMSTYRVLRIMHRMSISGPTYHATYLTRYLNNGFETLLVSGMVESFEKDGKFIMDEIGVKPKYLKKMQRSISFKEDYNCYREIREIIRDYKPHIVHTHAAKSGALGRLAAIHENVPIVLHTFHGHVFHSYFNRLKSMAFLQIERYLAKRSSLIIAISQQQKNELGARFKVCADEKIAVVHLGFDLEKFRIGNDVKREMFRDEFGLQDDDIAIGIIGRVTEVKNHAHFLYSFKKLIDRSQNNIKGFVVGDGDLLQETKDLANTLGLSISDGSDLNIEADLYFTSWREDIDQIMNGLDIVALTSLNEGTPVTLIEAQACKKPIVSTRVGGIVDIVKENETALLSDKNDIEAFADNMYRLVEDPELRTKFGNNGDFVFEEFSYQRLVRDIEALYRKLLNEKQVSVLC